jgi:ligand-binding SRPBCC domain-containing protein
MTTIQHEVFAACPPERVWAVLADLEAVQQYNPGVRRAAVEGSQTSGVGARRACDLLPTGRVVERVTLWEEGGALGLEVTESNWPIHFMRWVTRLEARERGTRITQSLEYQVKFGPLGWLLNRLVMKRKLTKTLDGVFASLVQHVERGTAPGTRFGT